MTRSRAAALLTGPVEVVAPRLLGAAVHVGGVVVRLTEVEAYDGADDAGSHAFRGPTPRNAVMFGPAGHLYCYFSYGMHVCANVVTGPEGRASAVLLRAGEVVTGLDLARVRRGDRPAHELARGPANLCRALGIGLDHGGTDLTGAASAVRLVPPAQASPPPASSVRSGPRVGLTQEPDRPWRFWLAGERSVSAYRRSPRAAPAPPSPDPRFDAPRTRC